ncbi:MAG: hypothetical protein QF752_09545 [Planctomycetota bacterium]|jgi:hypothetical protein|nr:hypothetical protein [Planctomycetota bacterium]
MFDRQSVLKGYGARGEVLEELLSYGENRFSFDDLNWPLNLPLADEAHLEAWDRYFEASQDQGAFSCLQNRFPQLWFPVEEGMSQQDLYRAATLRGDSEYQTTLSHKQTLQAPEKVRIFCYPTLAGRVPMITAGDREDFVFLLQALFQKNEPHPVPDAVGATMGSGYNNWDRIRQYQKKWMKEHPFGVWSEEFQQLISRKELYQDKFILLSEGVYSNLDAEEVGVPPQEWSELSLRIRMEHESTHFMTARFFGSIHNCAFEEIIADYTGMVEATGAFHADWFLRFMGLENHPEFRETGRLIRYRGTPPLSEEAFGILQKIIVDAVRHIEEVDRRRFSGEKRSLREKALMFFTLTQGNVEEWASGHLETRLEEWDQDLETKITGLG